MEITLESLLLGVLSIGLGVIGYFLKSTHNDFKERFEKMEKRMENHENEIDQIRLNHQSDMSSLKFNYIARFEEVNKAIQSLKEDVMQGIQNLDQSIKKQSQFCYLIQEQKKTDISGK